MALLAALAYVPALRSAPGRMPTDTKLYLYLNPGRLIADAPFTWDTRQFAGWVPHQTIAYLWPSGPWFWVFEKLGVPDWVAHRLWIGTILFLAGLGIRFAARQLGLTPAAGLTAALVYQLSPYVLPYISRTSVMLLPWAGLGWLIGLTVRACSRTRWRDAALFALVVLTIGAVNATAIILIAPAPVLWLAHAAWQRTITWRRAAITALKLGGLSLLVSLWWIVMLLVQGRHGADVLSFSETLDAVSHTSNSTETLRGLGYWLFYVRDPYAFTTTSSVPYMASGVVIAAGYALTTIGLAGIAITRWSQRRFAALLVLVGLVLAVGVHPIDDPSPLSAPLKTSALGLAIRSSTRALPLFVLGIALGAGALVTALGATRIRGRAVAPAAIGLLALVNIPSLRSGALVDPALERGQDVPAAWTEAAAALDATSSEYRVLQLPGSEFGAFRWGYTVDPPLPGLTDKPLVTRDLLPLGSPGAMDLLYALDNRMQEGTIEPAEIAPVARLLGVDTIWVPDDLAFDRFRTPRPEVVSALFAQRPPGLGAPVAFGDPTPNVPTVSMVDEEQLTDARLGTPLPAVELVPVSEPQPIVRASSRVVVLAGSGDGVVDAAGAGLLRGDEALLYSADLTPAQLAALPVGTPVVITDSNRDRAYQWRGSQDVTGLTETGGPGSDLTRVDVADQRLSVFAAETGSGATGGNQTTASLDDGLRVTASAYGEPFAYRPEDRPAMAVDGDPSTAWEVADRGDPIGQSIGLSSTTGSLRLLQRQDPTANRTVTRIRVEQPGVAPHVVALDDSSRSAPGQVVTVQPGLPATLVIVAVAEVPGATDSGPSGVGFAELGPVAAEHVRTPGDAAPAIRADTPLDVVLTRDRTSATNRWRSDPEPALDRTFALPVARTATATVTLRLDRRATDAVIYGALGLVPVATANTRLTGEPVAGGASAVDGDPATAWITPFGDAIGSTLTVRLDGSTPVQGFDVLQPAGTLHSPITALHVRLGALDADIAVPAADADGRSHVVLPTATTGDALTLTVTAVDSRTTVDRRFAEVVQLPAAITELSGLPLAPPAATPAADSCRTDLLTLDGAPLGVELTAASLATLRAGGAVGAASCGTSSIPLAAGDHHLAAAAGLRTGLDVDRIVLDSNGLAASSGAADAAQPSVTVQRTRTERTAKVAPCPTGCWLILGEGYNTGWSATGPRADGSRGDLGPPTQIAGGFNGWWLPPSSSARTITMTWMPQEGLDIALLLAALGVLACVALAVADRRHRAPLVEVDPPRFDRIGRRSSLTTAAVAAATLVMGGALVIAPLWGAILVVPAAVVVLTRRLGLVAVTSAVLTGVLGSIVVRRELSKRYFVNAGWPDHFGDLHRWGLLVVVLLLAGCLGSERSRREQPPTG